MDVDTLYKIALQWGPAWVVAIGAGWYVIQHDRACNAAHDKAANNYKEERSLFLQSLDKRHADAMSIMRETNNIIKSNTEALSKLIIIVENKK